VKACEGADVLVVLTEWSAFALVDLAEVRAAMTGSAVIDARNLLDPAAVRAAGLSYVGVGR
jgi:UDPglucose 6-dehydrogenase